MKSQKEAVLKHLQTYKSITSMEAIAQYGCTRLSDTIYRLKKEGFDISTERKQTKTKYGTIANFALYRYHGEKHEES